MLSVSFLMYLYSNSFYEVYMAMEMYRSITYFQITSSERFTYFQYTWYLDMKMFRVKEAQLFRRFYNR